MSDMQFWKPHDFRETLYLEAFGVLIMNLTSDFQNSKWRTQYGGHNILTSDFHSSKWRIQYRGHDMKLYDFRTTLY